MPEHQQPQISASRALERAGGGHCNGGHINKQAHRITRAVEDPTRKGGSCRGLERPLVVAISSRGGGAERAGAGERVWRRFGWRGDAALVWVVVRKLRRARPARPQRWGRTGPARLGSGRCGKTTAHRGLLPTCGREWPRRACHCQYALC